MQTIQFKDPNNLFVCNSSQFGNNARVAPHASVTDGLMDLCFVRKVPLSQAVAFTARLFMGIVHKSRYVEIVQASSFRLELAEPIAFHIDGEPHPPAQLFDASIQPGSLRMVVPIKSPL